MTNVPPILSSYTSISYIIHGTSQGQGKWSYAIVLYLTKCKYKSKYNSSIFPFLLGPACLGFQRMGPEFLCQRKNEKFRVHLPYILNGAGWISTKLIEGDKTECVLILFLTSKQFHEKHLHHVRKSHMACLNPRYAVYIFIRQLYLMLIGFMIESNIALEPIIHLDFAYSDRYLTPHTIIF